MKHASTRAVFAHWNERRRNRPAPQRADIDPVAIRHALGDTIMLSADFVEHLRFRLAGTRVCALFGRELKGEEFSDLWNEQSHTPVEDLLAVVTDESSGAVAGLTARTATGEATELELLLLPIAHADHTRIRALGVMVPVLPPYWLGARPVTELELGTLRHIGADTEGMDGPTFVPASHDSRIRHGFVVYSGGRGRPDKTG